VLGTAAVWGIVAGLALPMVSEWLTGDVFSKWHRDDSSTFAVGGGALGLAVAAAATLELGTIAVAAATLLFAAGTLALLYIRDPRL
jgi:hypothetical protein